VPPSQLVGRIGEVAALQAAFEDALAGRCRAVLLAGAPGVTTHNLTFQPGAETPDALRRGSGEGLWVTSMFGPSLNANTGDWSVGVSGFWFEKGELAYPVNEITVAGNLIDIYQRIVPASDLEIRGSSNAPSLLVDGLAIAGA